MIIPVISGIPRSSHQRCSIKNGVARNFTKSTGKQLCQSLFFNKVAGLRHSSGTGERIVYMWASGERIIYIIFSSKSSNGNVKDLTAGMSLLNSPTKSAYVNITFVFDAITLSYCSLLSHDSLFDYWLSSILCCQKYITNWIFSLWTLKQYIKTEMLMRAETFLLTFFNMPFLWKKKQLSQFPFSWVAIAAGIRWWWTFTLGLSSRKVPFPVVQKSKDFCLIFSYISISLDGRNLLLDHRTWV